MTLHTRFWIFYPPCHLFCTMWLVCHCEPTYHNTLSCTLLPTHTRAPHTGLSPHGRVTAPLHALHGLPVYHRAVATLLLHAGRTRFVYCACNATLPRLTARITRFATFIARTAARMHLPFCVEHYFYLPHYLLRTLPGFFVLTMIHFLTCG